MKKKVIKPFNINEYLDVNNNYKVETRCGYPIMSLMPETICIGGDKNINGMTDFPIMAELSTPIGMRIAFYTTEGTFYRVGESDLDLVLVEEQEVLSVTKKEFETHIEWFIDHVSDTVKELDKKVAEYFAERLLQEAIRNYTNEPTTREAQPTTKDAQEENVKYCALKLEGLENMPAEGMAMAYVRDAVGSVNKVLGYSAKERNAFSWKKVWDNQGYFGVIEEENAKKIVEKCPDFAFRLYYKSNITSDDHGEA